MRAVESFILLAVLLVLLAQTIYADVVIPGDPGGGSPGTLRVIYLLVSLFYEGICTVAVAGLTLVLSLPGKPGENAEIQKKSNRPMLSVILSVIVWIIGIILTLILLGLITILLVRYLISSENYLLLPLVPLIIGVACGKAATMILKGRIRYLKHKKALIIFFVIITLACTLAYFNSSVSPFASPFVVL